MTARVLFGFVLVLHISVLVLILALVLVLVLQAVSLQRCKAKTYLAHHKNGYFEIISQRISKPSIHERCLQFQCKTSPWLKETCSSLCTYKAHKLSYQGAIVNQQIKHMCIQKYHKIHAPSSIECTVLSRIYESMNFCIEAFCILLQLIYYFVASFQFKFFR